MSYNVVQRLSRGINLSGLHGAVELRCVALYRTQLVIEHVAYINHERRLHVVLAEGYRVENLLWSVRWRIRCDLRESRDKARVADELSGDYVVGMPALQRRCDDDARAQATDRRREECPGFRSVGEASVRQSEINALPNSEDLRCRVGFLRPQRGGPSGSSLARGEINDRGDVALARRLDQAAAAC